MSRRFNLLPLLGLVGLSYATYGDYLTNNALEMNQWGTTSTYSARVDMGGVPITYEAMLWAANSCFNWLKDQPYVTTSGSGVALVACVGVPGSNEAFCASVPRGDAQTYFGQLFANAAGATPAAPIWQQVVRGLLPAGTTYWAHAEDHAYYRLETEGSTPLAGPMYPDGTVVAVWHGRSGGDKGVGEAYTACHYEDGKVPGCMQVGDGLGVTYANQDPFAALRNARGTPAQPNTLTGRTLPNEQKGQKAKRQDVAAPPADDTVALPSEVISEISSFDSSATSTSSSSSSSSSGTITQGPTATPTCYLRGPDPDAGITASGCDCNGGTYPVLSTTDGANVSEQCAYTELPSKTTSFTPNLGPAQTLTRNCEVCTRVENNSDDCTSIPNCLKETAQASATAATSGVNVGTLTGAELYTSVSSALEDICPPVTQTTTSTQCSGTATIKNIGYVEADTWGDDGTLTVSPLFPTAYNTTSLRDAMIATLATIAQQSATGNNCYEAEYEVLVKRWLPPHNSSISGRDHPEPEFEKKTICNTAGSAQVLYYNEYWREAPSAGPADFLSVDYGFHVSGGDFACEFMELLADALAVVQPEFAVADVELGEAIETFCQAIEDSG